MPTLMLNFGMLGDSVPLGLAPINMTKIGNLSPRHGSHVHLCHGRRVAADGQNQSKPPLRIDHRRLNGGLAISATDGKHDKNNQYKSGGADQTFAWCP